ncbi:M16 family metallopeptidase [Ferrimonas senticii]|uniref:M16 family metallopeptidase n=1 Tax=Ferrimonas senticii TaxID=394566 RepID=UPI00040734FA|nr:insulinase family protein [Ferrimonas senticii]
MLRSPSLSRLALLCSSILLGSSLSTPALAQYQWDPSLIRGQLDNGLNYLVHDSNKPSDPFNLRLVVHAGSVDEATPSGVAHMVEHMVFQQTKAHPETIHNYLAELGWKTGLQVNAMTRQTETQYMVRTRPNDSLDSAGALALLADMAGGAKMTAADWQRERGVILEEWRRGEDVASRVNDQKKAVIRNGSRYVDRPTIGTEHNIRTTDIAALRDFYQRFYVPANMTLVVSGEVDSNSIAEQIEQTFGKLAAKPAPNRDYVPLPLADQLHIGLVQDPQGTSSQVAYGFRSEMPERNSEAGQYAYLQNYFLRKLVRNQVIRNRALLPEGVDSISITIKEPTNNRIVAAIAARTDDHDAGLAAIHDELARLHRDGLDPTEFAELLAKAKQIAVRNVEAAKHRDFAKWEDKITEAVVLDGVLEDPQIRSERTLMWLEQLTIDDLNARMRQLISAEDQFLYYQVPGDKTAALPTEAEVRRDQAQIDASSLSASIGYRPAKPKVEQKVVLPSLPISKLHGSVISSDVETLTLATGDNASLHRYQLSNGDSVLWLNHATRDNKLYIKALSSSGYHNDGMPSWQAQMGVQLWEQSGLQGWNQQQWQALQQQPHWSWKLQPFELDMGAVATEAELPQLLQLYQAQQQQGQISTEAFNQVKQDWLAELAQTENKPYQQQASLQRFGGAAKQGKLSQQALTDLTLPMLTASTKKLLAEPTQFFIVGKMDAEQLPALLSAHLAGIPRQRTLTAAPLLQQPGRFTSSVEVHNNHKANVTAWGFTPMPWSPEQAFLLSTLNPIAQAALKQKLRLELSGVYSVKFELFFEPQLNRVNSELSFSCAPERAEELLAAAEQVLADLPSTLAEVNFDRTRSDIAFAESGRVLDANTWLRRLVLSEQRYGDARYLLHTGKMEQLVQPEQLQRLAKQVLPQPHRVAVIGMPLAK